MLKWNDSEVKLLLLVKNKVNSDKIKHLFHDFLEISFWLIKRKRYKEK
jgi:hypothetical protein